MRKDDGRIRDDWPAAATSLTDGTVAFGPHLVPKVPSDGRDLPDIELDRLVEAILANIASTAIG